MTRIRNWIGQRIHSALAALPHRLPTRALVLLMAMTVSMTVDARHKAGNFDDLKQRIDDIRSTMSVPGGSVIIVDRDGVVWRHYFGVADVDTHQPVSAETAFRIGSVTKLFTAATLVRLSRRDDFSLEDMLSKHLFSGQFFNAWEDSHPVTVAQLLEHTSGLRDWTKAEFDYNLPLSLEQGLAFSPQSRTTHWQPGLHHVYSNANYGLAGLVIEHVSGMTYENAVRQALFDPLEMTSATTLFARTTGLATGYARDGRTPIPYWHMIQRPAAAVNIKPHEMSALISMLLNRGQYQGQTVLTPEEVKRMETPRTSLAARHGLRFGYGLGLYSHYRNGFLFHEHGGDGDGYLARLGYCRELGLGYFVTINSDNPLALSRLRRVIEYALLKNHPALTPPPVIELDAALLQRYSGRYALAAWRFDWNPPQEMAKRELVVRVTPDGNLFTENSNGEHGLLLAVDEQRFRRMRDGGASAGFYEENGKLYFQEDDNWVRVSDIEPEPRARGDKMSEE